MKKYKLGEIAEIYNGSTPASTKPEYYGGDIIWITPKDLSDQGTKYIDHGERSITQAGYDSCSTTLIPAGNILMSSRAPIGLLAINKVDCCTNQGFKNIVVNKKIADTEYIYYFLMQNIESIKRLSGGTTFQEVSKKTLEQCEFEIPDLSEQQRIAKILSTIDAKIELNKKISRELEAMAEQGKPYKSSGGKMVWNETLKREIPEGWEVKKLGEVLIIKNGKDYKKSDIGIYPVYGSGGLICCINSFMFSGESILLPRKGTLSNILYVNEAFSTIDTMFYSEISNQKLIKYLFYALQKSNYTKLSSGTGRPSMTASAYQSINIILPTQSLLDMFELQIKDSYVLMQSIQSQSRVLNYLRDYLLPLLMNGQVRVSQS